MNAGNSQLFLTLGANVNVDQMKVLKNMTKPCMKISLIHLKVFQ